MSTSLFAEAGMDADRASALRDWASWEISGGDQVQGEAMWREARDLFDRLGLELFVARMDADLAVHG